MKDFISTIHERHEAFIKEAFVGALAGMAGRGLVGVGKLIARNPLKTLGAGFTAHDVVSSAQRANKITGAGHTMADTVRAATPKFTM